MNFDQTDKRQIRNITIASLTAGALATTAGLVFGLIDLKVVVEPIWWLVTAGGTLTYAGFRQLVRKREDSIRSIGATVESRQQPINVSPDDSLDDTQIPILQFFADRPFEFHTADRIAAVLQIDQLTLAVTLRKLVERGLLDITPNAATGPQYHLTADGQEFVVASFSQRPNAPSLQPALFDKPPLLTSKGSLGQTITIPDNPLGRTEIDVLKILLPEGISFSSFSHVQHSINAIEHELFAAIEDLQEKGLLDVHVSTRENPRSRLSTAGRKFAVETGLGQEAAAPTLAEPSQESDPPAPEKTKKKERKSRYVSHKPPDRPDVVVENEEDPHDDLQLRVMKFFAEVDGGYYTPDSLAARMRVNNLRLDAALEALMNGGFIHTKRHHWQGIQYGLTSAGRDFVIKEKFDQQPDEDDAGHFG